MNGPLNASGRLLLAAVEAGAVADANGSHLARPLREIADVLRSGDGQPEDEIVAGLLAEWLTSTPNPSTTKRTAGHLHAVPDACGTTS